MGVDGWDGSKYVLNLVDNASRCCATYLLKNKSDALGRFMDFVRSAERQSGKKLKIFRSDNGGEFTGRAFKDFLSDNGIAHQLSVPRTPQQNGVAERVGRTITTITRAILRDSNLPQLRWPDAMRHATHLYNRTPHSSVFIPA
jgi:transposase InsO family protein